MKNKTANFKEFMLVINIIKLLKKLVNKIIMNNFISVIKFK